MNEKVKKVKDLLKEQGPTIGSSAVGATAGVVVGTVITPDAEAEQTPNPEPEPPTPGPVVGAFEPTKPVEHPMPPKPGPEPHVPPKPEPEPPVPPKPVTPVPPVEEVEVLAYERVTNDDGSQMDIAVVNSNGEEMAYVDVNLDGIADVKIYDVNGDGVIQDTETEILTDQNISMISMQDAAGFNPLYAQNDIPDYVNDADTDVYMA